MPQEFDKDVANVPKRRSQVQRRQETRSKLIQAVIDAIGSKGFAALRTKDIVERADMTWGAAQHIFGDKDELLLQAAILLSEELVARLTARVDLKKPLENRASQVIRQTWAMYSSPYHFAMAEIVQGKRFEPEFHGRLVDAQFRIHGEIERQWLKIFGDTGIERERLRLICNMSTLFLSGLSSRMFYIELRESPDPMLSFATNQLVCLLRTEMAAAAGVAGKQKRGSGS